jgi:hypothetical protein
MVLLNEFDDFGHAFWAEVLAGAYKPLHIEVHQTADELHAGVFEALDGRFLMGEQDGEGPTGLNFPRCSRQLRSKS